jgi:hypothetical protein
MEYIINGVNEKGESLIEKRGHVITFTIQQVEDHKKLLAKSLKEYSAMKQVFDAKAQNIVNNNPEISDMTEEKIHAVWFYYEQFHNSKKYGEKIVEVENQIKEYDEELAEIKKQTGIETLSVESPIQDEQSN